MVNNKKPLINKKNESFVIIRYAIILLKYTIFSNISYIIVERIIKPNKIKIKYVILRFENKCC